MTPEERQLLQEIGVNLCGETLTSSSANFLAYGFFVPLLMTVIQSLVRKHQKTPLSWAMLVATVIGFLSMTVIITTTLWSDILLVSILLNSYGTLGSTANHYNNTITGSDIAIIWLQYLPPIFNDGVILWRAWVISGHRRRVSYASIVAWICSFALTLSMIIYQTTHFVELSQGTTTDTVFIGLTMSSLALSMAVNLAGTTLIAYILWNNLRFLRQLGKLKHQFNAWRILLLLFESGAAYAVLQLVFILLTLVPSLQAYNIAHYTFSNLYVATSMVYPALTIAIISGPFSMDRVQESVVEVQTLSEGNQNV